jgi:hypothetical protein
LKCSSVGGRVVVTSGGDDGDCDTAHYFYVKIALGSLFLLARGSQTLAAAERCARFYLSAPEPKTKLLVCELTP